MQATKWSLLANPSWTPQQRNGFDCGVFAVMCCECCAVDSPLDYAQKDMPSLRAKIALDCARADLAVVGAAI